MVGFGPKPAPPRVPKNTPVVLAVLDGWGIAEKGPGNAVEAAKTPFMDMAQKKYPHAVVRSHGRYVGLLPHQEGNSEAGHMNIGAGRTVRQDIVVVSEAIKDGTFFKNTAFREVFKHARKYGTRVHLMGMLADGNSAHAAPDHIHALLKLCHDEKMPDVRLHLFTDGRDSPPFSATHLLHEIEHSLSPGQMIATVMGRFYAMDRNKLWHRTELAYNAIVNGEGLAVPNAHAAIIAAYNRGESDEFILPSVVVDGRHRPVGMINDDDVIIFFNLRSDRARQLTKCLVQRDFETKNRGAFTRSRVPKSTRFAAMSEFGPDLDDVFTAFPSASVKHGLTETLSPLRQFYIAESEKYAHVTYFFNGGYDTARFGEERMRVPSQFVPHHDSAPEMRAGVIADEVVRRIRLRQHDFIAINFANADMVGHTGNLKPTVKAVEAVDACLARIAEAVKEAGGALVIVGDHGNAERKINLHTGAAMTEHTDNPVPFVIVSEALKKAKLDEGILADVAPTVLDVMDWPKPADMSGFSLLRT